MPRKSRAPGELPALTENLSSVSRYSRAVAEGMVCGAIAPVVGRELLKAASLVKQTISTRHAQSELAEMRKLVAAAEKAAARQKKNAIEDTFSTDEDMGRERPAPPPAPNPEPVCTERPAPAEPTS
jgi:hypothetical protein